MSEWTTARLADIADIRFSNVDKKSIPGELQVRLCNYMDVYTNDYIADNLPFMEATASQAEIERFRVAKGDVMLTKDSETPDDIGISAVVVDDIPDLVCGYHLALIKPRKDKVDPVYLAKQLSSKQTATYFSRLANGSTRYGLSSSAIANTSIPLAPLPHQRRIAEILSTLDEAIEQTEALIAMMLQAKAGLMHDLFTRGVTPDGRLRPTREQAPDLYKESPLGWIPKEWEVKQLEEVADVNRGKFSIRPRNDPRYYGGAYPFIQTGDVSLAQGRVLTGYSQTLNDAGLAVSRLFETGTIMVTIAANIADTCILGIPMCAPDSLVGVQPNRGQNIRFLELCIRRRKAWFEARAPQTAQKNINLEDLRPLPVPAPSIREQEIIAEIYENIDHSLATSEIEVGKHRQQKHGLMHDLLTGCVKIVV
jgi:type I restriction enzyme S subunit